MQTTDKPKGLRKFIPNPQLYAERYGTLTLTARDIEIIDLVYRYRHLEVRHIQALLNPEGSAGVDRQIAKRLQGLFHNRYLGRYVPRERMRMELGTGSPRIVYGLETGGWRVLKERLKELRQDGEHEEIEAVTWQKAHTRRMEGLLPHQVMISHFRCVLEVALRAVGDDLRLHEWDQSKKIGGQVTLRGGRSLSVKPDAYFAIQRGRGIRNFYVEFDRSSMERWRIAEKFEKYWWWLQSPAYQEVHYDHKRVNVLFASTGAERMANMMDVLAGKPYPRKRKEERFEKPNKPPYGGRGWFLFALEDDYQLEEPASILEPIWRTVTKTDRISLI